MNLLEFLQNNPFLSDLDQPSIDELLNTIRIYDAPDGTILIEEGGAGNTALFLLEGEIVITKLIQGQDVELDRLEPGDMFGILTLIDDTPRQATCVASGSVKVASLPQEIYEGYRNNNPIIALALQRAIGGQLAHDYRNIAQKTKDFLKDLSTAIPSKQEIEHTRETRYFLPSIPTKGDLEFDVVVIGGGPLGMMYATWIKQFRPETSVAVIERQESPRHKVGESTLGTTTRSFYSMGLSYPALRRLFGNKAGLRFFYTDENTDELQRQVDVVDIDETFQVERRVLEIALQETSRRHRVEIMRGTKVKIKESNIGGKAQFIVCEGPDGEKFTIKCNVVCDASGSASVLLRHLGHYRKNVEMYQTFSTNSYFAYFRPKKDVPVKFWDYPATRHICFPGGWLWFISLTSWEGSPSENVREMVEYLLDHPEGADETFIPRDELAEKFGCQSEQRLSIGFVIRDDLDVEKLPIAERFQHYVDKHPAIKWVMDHYELIEEPYEGKRRAYSAFMKMAHDAEQVTGNGWCVIGDAAMFPSPFFSPGLNFGSGTAYMAAQDTVKALDSGDYSRPSFATYEKYAGDIFLQLMRETDWSHRSFNHIDSYERGLAARFFFGALDVISRESAEEAKDGYQDTDPFVFDLLNPVWVEATKAMVEVQREGEENGTPPAEVAAQFRAIVDPLIEKALSTPGYDTIGIERFLSFYDGDGTRNENKVRPKAIYAAIPCSNCSRYADELLPQCPYCGVDLHEMA